MLAGLRATLGGWLDSHHLTRSTVTQRAMGDDFASGKPRKPTGLGLTLNAEQRRHLDSLGCYIASGSSTYPGIKR
jgi:hypothetical protein